MSEEPITLFTRAVGFPQKCPNRNVRIGYQIGSSRQPCIKKPINAYPHVIHRHFPTLNNVGYSPCTFLKKSCRVIPS